MIRRSFLSAMAAWLPSSTLVARWRPVATSELPPIEPLIVIGKKSVAEQVYDRVLAVAAEYPDFTVSTHYLSSKTGKPIPGYVSIGLNVLFEGEDGQRYPVLSVRMILDDAEGKSSVVEWLGCIPCPDFKFDYEAFVDTIENPTVDSVDRAEIVLRRGLDAMRKIDLPARFVRKNHMKQCNELIVRGHDGIYRGRPSGNDLARLLA